MGPSNTYVNIRGTVLGCGALHQRYHGIWGRPPHGRPRSHGHFPKPSQLISKGCCWLQSFESGFCLTLGSPSKNKQVLSTISSFNEHTSG